MRYLVVAFVVVAVLSFSVDATCHMPGYCGSLGRDEMTISAPTVLAVDGLGIFAMAHHGDGRVPAHGIPEVSPGGWLVLQVDVYDAKMAGQRYSVAGLDGLAPDDQLVTAWGKPYDGIIGGEPAMVGFDVVDFSPDSAKLDDGTPLPNIRPVGFNITISHPDALPRSLEAQVPIKIVLPEIIDDGTGSVPEPSGERLVGTGVVLTIGAVGLACAAFVLLRFRPHP